MLTEEEEDKLFDIFYSEAPYDYVLVIEKRKNPKAHGSCSYEGKVAYLYGPDNFIVAKGTVLHEIAHARIQHWTHSDVWEKEFVSLLKKYNYPKDMKYHNHTIIGPNVREYMNDY